MNVSANIKLIEYELLANKLSLLKPRERYVQYLRDLYKIYPGKLSEETFYEGAQASYSELGDALFSKISMNKELSSLDTIIIAHWSQEFDPEYASCGPYFLHNYNLNSDVFDICDQGTLAPFMALKILKQKIELGDVNKGMVLCLEQSTIPRDKNAGDIVPMVSGSVGMILSNDISNYQISLVDFVTEAQALEYFGEIENLISKRLESHGVNLEDTLIITRKNTGIWKSLKYSMLSGESNLLFENIEFIEPNPGCLSAFMKIAQVITKDIHEKHILVIDEDIESLNFAYLLMEKKS